jgi:hypothetical protein
LPCDEPRNFAPDSVITLAVTNNDSALIRLPRSAKLRQQATNCLSIAVREKAPDFAADLIDEAIRLAQRARELETPKR